jgi:hypothetical protein
MIKSLLRAMEERKQKQEHANQIENLTEQIEEITEKIKTQLSNIQASSSANPSYAPSSQPSNLRILSSMNTTPSTVTDTLSRVGEEHSTRGNQASN